MIFLLLSILSSFGIFLIFRLASRNKAHLFSIIIINYFVAAILGFFLTSKNIPWSEMAPGWYFMSLLIGILFIIMFFIVGKSSEKAGIAITTVASKMSVVIPITISLLIDPLDIVTVPKSLAIIMTFIAVFLTVYKRRAIETETRRLLYPVLLFFGMGLVDSLVKIAQLKYVDEADLAFFSAILFSVSAISGLIAATLFKNTRIVPFSLKNIIHGIPLGVVNFGSIYFFIRALDYNTGFSPFFDSSVIFGINNLGIVSLSVLTGLLAFREKLSALNWTGISLSVIAIVVLSYL